MAHAVQNHLLNEGITHYHVIGHSLGGKVAMAMAGNPLTKNDKKNTIGRMVIVDIAPRLYPPHHNQILDALHELPLNELKSRTDADKRLRQRVPDATVRQFVLKSLYRSETTEGEVEYGWRFNLNQIRKDYDLMRQIPTFTQKIDVPTLFVKGGNSDYLLPQDELPIRTNFKDPHFKMIGNTGHWPHAEKPALFTRLCIDFLTNDNTES